MNRTGNYWILVNVGTVAKESMWIAFWSVPFTPYPGFSAIFPVPGRFVFFFFAAESPRARHDRWYRLSMTEERLHPGAMPLMSGKSLSVRERADVGLPKRKNPTSVALYPVSSLCKCQTIPDTPISRSGVKWTDPSSTHFLFVIFYASGIPVRVFLSIDVLHSHG